MSTEGPHKDSKSKCFTSTRRPMLAMCGEDSLTVSSFSIWRERAQDQIITTAQDQKKHFLLKMVPLELFVLMLQDTWHTHTWPIFSLSQTQLWQSEFITTGVSEWHRKCRGVSSSQTAVHSNQLVVWPWFTHSKSHTVIQLSAQLQQLHTSQVKEHRHSFTLSPGC